MPNPGIGGAALTAAPKIIRFALHGHANRPFFHIVLTNYKVKADGLPVEQLGAYDPMPNIDNQKLLSLNIERTRYWMGQGATFSKPVAKLLGLVGFLDIHPDSYIQAWRARSKSAARAEEDKAKDAATGDIPTPAQSSS